MSYVREVGDYVNFTSSTLVRTGAGCLLGVGCASASSGPAFKVFDGVSSGTTVIYGSCIPIAGVYYPIPATFQTGLTITVAGQVDLTLYWNPIST